MSVWGQPGGVTRLRELVATKATAEAIACALSREFDQTVSRSAVLGKAKRLGLVVGDGRKGPVKPAAPKPRRVTSPASRKAPPQETPSAPKRAAPPVPAPPPPPPIEGGAESGRAVGFFKDPDDAPLGERPTSPGPRRCHYIYGEPSSGRYSYCGDPAKPGSSWCPDHHRRCHSGVRVALGHVALPRWALS
ncbi:GcrA family cell cycle regulator [Minwuia thermotolerans]|uniref:GcrA cell cycle regulator n=1 Tax=Minwuia thermotolerans TaxID=2056226 RepID=A0A2M9G2L5_9PROT|nr:GcrA family cell cycle regulator [Minwuia thermotolerans]PJK29934.1 hypothetical protein CVT23_09195 [Minwuia thermotolerans]